MTTATWWKAWKVWLCVRESSECHLTGKMQRKIKRELWTKVKAPSRSLFLRKIGKRLFSSDLPVFLPLRRRKERTTAAEACLCGWSLSEGLDRRIDCEDYQRKHKARKEKKRKEKRRASRRKHLYRSLGGVLKVSERKERCLATVEEEEVVVFFSTP